MERVYTTLDEYRQAMHEHGVERGVAVMTSAVRDAANGREFADEVGRRFALEPHILSGDEEAGLTFLGAMSERDPADRTRTLVIDIGGGSTELVIGEGREVRFHVSTQAGVVRQTERHLHWDPPTDAELDALCADVRAIFPVPSLPAGGGPCNTRSRSPAPPLSWPRSPRRSCPTTPRAFTAT